MSSIINALFLIVSAILSLTGSLLFVKWWIKKGFETGITGKDMNKPGKPEVVEAGGVWVSVAASFGLLTYIALRIYSGFGDKYILELMALSLLLFMSSFLGFLDDILGWKKGLSIKARVLGMAPLAIPMMVIKAGCSTMALPFIGVVDFGLLYPLLLVPIGILGAANAFNMIAGYNGLEAGQGLLLMFFTAIYCYLHGIHPSFEASIVMMFALLGFLRYNWYPAKTFPGNSLTYGFGAYYASLIILGNFEKYGLLLFTLYFIEFLLFIRGILNGVYKENFGKVNSDGSLSPPYSKTYSLTHLAIKIQLILRGKATEKGVVYTILLMQALIGIVSLLVIEII